MQNAEQMIRGLYPAQRLRDQYGLNISAAMQCDVDGISWLYADLLVEAGIELLTMAVNPIRGYVPKPVPGAFWWQGPGGRTVLAWNGLHYLWGRSIAKLGDWRFVDDSLPAIIAGLETDPDYPFDFLYAQSTHPMRVDNGPPDPRMAAFVEQWNAEERTPRIEFTTPSIFNRFLRDQWGDKLSTVRGDWLDWWSDGVASSAFETGVSRATHEHLLMAETLGAWLASEGKQLWTAERARDAYEAATLYDEHTWGAFASIDAPTSLWTRSQWNRKSGFAYKASAESLDLMARASRALAETVADPGIEGMFNLGDLDQRAAYPESGADSVLVLNTLPWERTVIVEEPELHGWAAPAGVLEAFFPRNIPWGGVRPATAFRRVTGTVPAFGYAFLPLDATPIGADLSNGKHTVENAFYRITVDPKTGALSEWYDKELKKNLAGSYQGWGLGQYVYERVESDEGRQAVFYGDFSLPDFGYGRTDTPWDRSTVTSVTVAEPGIAHGQATISVSIEAAGIRGAICTYTLESRRKALAIDWELDKIHETGIEAVFIALPFDLGKPNFRADVNGVPFTPEEDQLTGTVRDWYPIGRWIGVDDGKTSVIVSPLDAPMMQLGGITTGKWARKLEPEGPTLMSWALQNHWMVNFKASQGGLIPLRYRLTSQSGPIDDVAAWKFGAEAATQPITLRDYLRTGPETGRFMDIPEALPVTVWAKPAEDGDGIIVRIQNLSEEPIETPITMLSAQPKSAMTTSPLEIDDTSIMLDGATATVRVGANDIQSVRLRF